MFKIDSSTIQLLRFHFSFFLMPVYWFGLSQAKDIDTGNAVLIFIILHILVYPSSNGYNSYMDRDTDSIGGIKDPQQPTKQLFYTSIVLDIIALGLSMVISLYFFAGILLYIMASRAYSYRGIRLKKFPVIGYLTVIICQGALVFFLVMHGGGESMSLSVPLYGMIAASLLIGSFYPLTQIYQHDQDMKDGVNTLSNQLGYRGTFVFTAAVFAASMALLFIYLQGKTMLFFMIQLFLFPVLVYFFWWMAKVWNNTKEANFKNTMQMNLIASVCSNAAFIYLLISEH